MHNKSSIIHWHDKGLVMSLERIKEMEAMYNDVSEKFMDFQNQLAIFKEKYHDYLKLRNYYQSEAWFEDYHMYEEGLIPQDQTCAILAEDTIYHLMTDAYQLSLELLDMARNMLKN